MSKVCYIGGTFNNLHRGHREYIELAFNHTDEVVIFLTSDKFAQSYRSYPVKPYEERKNQINKFLKNRRYKIIKIDSGVEVEEIYLNAPDSILPVIAPEYLALFQLFNEKRVLMNKQPLQIIIKLRTKDENGNDISSTTHED